MSSFTLPDDVDLDNINDEELLDEMDLYDDDSDFLNIYANSSEPKKVNNHIHQVSINSNAAIATASVISDISIGRKEITIPVANTVPIVANLKHHNNDNKKKFSLPLHNNLHANLSSEQRLKLIREYNESIEINEKNIKFEKKQAGKIADGIRKNRALKKQQENQGRYTADALDNNNVSYVDLFSSTLQNLKQRAQEKVLGSSIPNDTPNVPLHELWAGVFQELNEDYVEFDVKARQNDDYFIKRVLEKLHDSKKNDNNDKSINENDEWDEFRSGILKIIRGSPRHSLSKTLRVFSHTLCLLHGPLFDLETEFSEMLQNNSHVFSTFINKKDLVDDIKCFVEMLVITIANKYNIIDRSYELNLLLYVVAQSAIFDVLGERIDKVMILREIQESNGFSDNNNTDVNSEKQLLKTNKELFDELCVKDIFQYCGGYDDKKKHNTATSSKHLGTNSRRLEPYEVAINHLKSILTSSNYPLGRLKILYTVLELVTSEMSKIALTHGKHISVGAEDLAPVIDFVIIKSGMSGILDPILKSLEELIPNSFWSGRYAYALTTFSISLGSMRQRLE